MSELVMAVLDAAAGAVPLNTVASRLSAMLEGEPVLLVSCQPHARGLRLLASSEPCSTASAAARLAPVERALWAAKRARGGEAQLAPETFQLWLAEDRQYVAGQMLPVPGEGYCIIVCGAPSGEPLARRIEGRLDELLPYVARAVQLLERLTETAARAAGHEAVLDRLPFGLVQLDGDRTLLHANAQALRIAQGRGSLAIRASGIQAVTEPEQERLQAAIGQAIASADGTYSSRISIRRANGCPPCSVLVTGVKGGEVPEVDRRAACLIYIADPDAQRPVVPEEVAEALGLTAAESRVVAALASGLPLPKAAAKFGVSINTARTLLARAMARTGTNSQIALVRTVLIALGVMPAEA